MQHRCSIHAATRAETATGTRRAVIWSAAIGALALFTVTAIARAQSSTSAEHDSSTVVMPVVRHTSGTTTRGARGVRSTSARRPNAARTAVHATSSVRMSNYVVARLAADRSTGFRVIVSLDERKLWVVDGVDTLRVAPIAVASGNTLVYGGRKWTFDTPRGRRPVLSKDPDPVWTPPEWHYAEVAKEHGLKFAFLDPKRPARVEDGRLLTVRGGRAGLYNDVDSTFAELPLDEHIVFDSTLYVPPVGSENRTVHGELGAYRLNLGDGFLLHGTPYKRSIGTASTHGCMRLGDDDIEWLYGNVPVGTPVYIY
jgi:lipoprotein-anchoring transpeptidase ErfK/SrfK